jgi:hypothetical protein
MEKSGLSGTIKIEKTDGSVTEFYLKPRIKNSKGKLGEKENGDTTTSNISEKRDR